MKKSILYLVLLSDFLFGIMHGQHHAGAPTNLKKKQVFQSELYSSIDGQPITFESTYAPTRALSETDHQLIAAWYEAYGKKVDQLIVFGASDTTRDVDVTKLRNFMICEGPTLSTGMRTLCRIGVSRRREKAKKYLSVAFVANALLAEAFCKKRNISSIAIPKTYLIKRDVLGGFDDDNVYVMQEYVDGFRVLSTSDQDILASLTYKDLSELYALIAQTGSLWDFRRNLGWDGKILWYVDLEARGYVTEASFFNKEAEVVQTGVKYGLRGLRSFFESFAIQDRYLTQIAAADHIFADAKRAHAVHKDKKNRLRKKHVIDSEKIITLKINTLD